MSSQARNASQEGLVEVRTLHVIAGDGETEDLRTVRCPVGLCTVTLAGCLTCGENDGLVPADGGPADRVRCRSSVAPPNSDPSATSARALLERTQAWAVMTKDVIAVRPDVSLEALADLFLNQVITGAPVVDERGRPVGVISRTDLFDERFAAAGTRESLRRNRRERLPGSPEESEPSVHARTFPSDAVSDAMTRGALSVAENAPMAEAAALMAARGVHRVLVTSREGKVVGIVTPSDIARWVAQAGGCLPG